MIHGVAGVECGDAPVLAHVEGRDVMIVLLQADMQAGRVDASGRIIIGPYARGALRG